jgi:hypothetical protein
MSYPANKIELLWEDQKYRLTVPLDSQKSNVATIRTSPGYSRYHSYCVQIDETDNTLANRVTIYKTHDLIRPDLPRRNVEEITVQVKLDFNLKEFMFNGPNNRAPSNEVRQASGVSPDEELLRRHLRHAHISMERLRHMGQLGILSSRLAKCRIAVCQSCMYGNFTRRAWRTKMNPFTKDNTLKALSPGMCVSVDQLESPLPGFVGLLKGTLTRKRYKVATIFVDHFSDLSLVHLQSTTNIEDTLQAKHDFESYASTFGVSIQHYHANNGPFADNAWRQDILN